MRPLGARRIGPADVVTLGNALCGTAAVLVVAVYGGERVADGGFRLVALLLLAGTMLDVLDGAVARYWGATPLGRPLDMMADAITFGVAPAVALATTLLPGEPWPVQMLLVAGAMTYTCGALVRLADFLAERHSDLDFTGLPSPLAAVCAVALGLLQASPVITALALAALGAWMVAPVRYPSQRGPLVAISLTGWGLGLLGLAGVLDVRVLAVITLLSLVVVVPVATAYGHGQRVAARIQP